VYNPLIITA